MSIGLIPLNLYRNLDLDDGVIMRMAEICTTEDMQLSIHKYLSRKNLYHTMMSCSDKLKYKGTGDNYLYETGVTDFSEHSKYFDTNVWQDYFDKINTEYIKKFFRDNVKLLDADYSKTAEIYKLIKDRTSEVFLPVVEKNPFAYIKKYHVAKYQLKNNISIILTYDASIPVGKIAVSNKLNTDTQLTEYIFSCYKGAHAEHNSYYVIDRFMNNYLEQSVSYDCMNYQKKDTLINFDTSDFVTTKYDHGTMFYSSDPSLKWRDYYESADGDIVSTYLSKKVTLPIDLSDLNENAKMFFDENLKKNHINIFDHNGNFTDKFSNIANQIYDILTRPYDIFIYNQSQTFLVYRLAMFADFIGRPLALKYIRVPTINIKYMDMRKSIGYDKLIKCDNLTGTKIMLSRLLTDQQSISCSSDFVQTNINCVDIIVNKLKKYNNSVNETNMFVEKFNLNDYTYGLSLFTLPVAKYNKIIDYICYKIPKIVNPIIANCCYNTDLNKIIIKQAAELANLLDKDFSLTIRSILDITDEQYDAIDINSISKYVVGKKN